MVLPQPTFTRNVMAKAPLWSVPKVREATFLVATLKLHGTAPINTKAAVIPFCSVCLDPVEWAHLNIASTISSMGSSANSSYGPTFGGGYDIHFSINSRVGHSYFTCLAESRNVDITEYEVFELEDYWGLLTTWHLSQDQRVWSLWVMDTSWQPRSIGPLTEKKTGSELVERWKDLR